MKYIKILLFTLFLAPVAAFAQSDEFMVAAQLLSAAKNADIQQVQVLINDGADVNYIDKTGLSLVCTALMNNDVRAAQILQMYGADASQCDKQIKQYRTRAKGKTATDGGGGLFGGLSSAQSLTLTAAGAAVVIGGLFLLTDVFDSDNGNSNGGGGDGNRPNNNGNGDNTGGATGGNAIPVGPAYFNASGQIEYSKDKYQSFLSQWNPVATNEGLRSRDFNFFRPDLEVSNPDTQTGGMITNPDSYKTAGITLPMQNYLLMMHGYSSFANGYMGQSTFRDSARNPVKVQNDAGGGVPIAVGLITANGINPVGSAGRGDGITYSDSAAADSNTNTVGKYVNDAISTPVSGAGIFDLSNSGTVMNPFVSPNDNALGKVIAGWEAGDRASGDLYGLVPNGRLAVYRTGGGNVWKNLETEEEFATIQRENPEATGIAAGDTITYGENTYKISLATSSAVINPTVTIGGTIFQVASDSNMLVAKCQPDGEDGGCENVSDMAIYRGTDGKYYVNYTGGNRPDKVLTIDGDNLMSVGEYVSAPVTNYQAMTNARGDSTNTNILPMASGHTSMAAIANASLNPMSRNIDYYNMSDMPALTKLWNATNTDAFIKAVDNYYEPSGTKPNGYTTQGSIAHQLFINYSSSNPIIVNPAGEFKIGAGAGESAAVLDATFENYVPMIYKNMEHNFMTVVAVMNGSQEGTTAANSIESYSNSSLYLSTRLDGETTYQSRKCGVAGMGLNGTDPWCFAAAGPTSEIATATAAGAVAAVRGAFPYMSNDNIFALLALTADGAYLGSIPGDNGSDVAASAETLVAYLQNMYVLPPEYRNNTNMTADEYLSAFRDVYGYGLINLERAMTPGKKIYYYDGNNIVSDKGNAYWRAATDTKFRTSSAFAPRATTISAPFYDVLESVDGEMSLPRVWKNEFTIGASDRRGLYMGDVLGEFKTRRDAPQRTQIGNIGFTMATSQRMYDDNMGGLDEMRFDYNIGKWDLAAGYQHHFTDGVSRFAGTSNPIFGLASNAVMSDAHYNMGRWSFGARAFSGAITDESLLENDPTLSARFEPARLGRISGASGDATWSGDKFTFNASIGTARESDTILGAQTGGLLNLGAGDTTYVDSEIRFSPRNDLSFALRSTFARTTANAAGEFILGLSDIESNAFAFGADIGNFSLSVARPLGVSRGKMQYAHAEYDIIDNGNGKYDLAVRDTHVADIDLSPEHRELRFTGEYRSKLGEFTDGAIGFIYRVNPNHTSEFGNESIFMLKMTHRLGI